MAIIKVNKLFVKVVGTNETLLTKVKEVSSKDQKIYFIEDKNEIMVGGITYGFSSDLQGKLAKIESILKTYLPEGNVTEDAVKTAIDAVKTALDEYKTSNDQALANNKADIESKAVGIVAYNEDTKAIDVTSVDGATTTSIPVSKIIGNHIVKETSYNKDTNKITIVFGGAESDNPVEVDLSDMLDMNDVVSSDVAHLTANYTEKKLSITPVVGALAGDVATAGLADAVEARTYVDNAIAGAVSDANDALDAYKTTNDARVQKVEEDLAAETERATNAEQANANAIIALEKAINEMPVSAYWEDFKETSTETQN